MIFRKYCRSATQHAYELTNLKKNQNEIDFTSFRFQKSVGS